VNEKIEKGGPEKKKNPDFTERFHSFFSGVLEGLGKPEIYDPENKPSAAYKTPVLRDRHRIRKQGNNEEGQPIDWDAVEQKLQREKEPLLRKHLEEINRHKKPPFTVPAGEELTVDVIKDSYIFIETGAVLEVKMAINSEFYLAPGAERPILHSIKNCRIVNDQGEEEKIDLEPIPITPEDYENYRPLNSEQLAIAHKWAGFLARVLHRYPLEIEKRKKIAESKLYDLELWQKLAEYYQEHLDEEEREELRELGAKTMSMTPKWKEILSELAGETIETVSDEEIEQTLAKLNEIQTVADQYDQTEYSDLSEEEKTQIEKLVAQRRETFENGEWEEAQKINDQIIALCQSQVPNPTINVPEKTNESDEEDEEKKKVSESEQEPRQPIAGPQQIETLTPENPLVQEPDPSQEPTTEEPETETIDKMAGNKNYVIETGKNIIINKAVDSKFIIQPNAHLEVRKAVECTFVIEKGANEPKIGKSINCKIIHLDQSETNAASKPNKQEETKDNQGEEMTPTTEQYIEQVVNETRTFKGNESVRIGLLENSVINLEDNAQVIIERIHRSKINLFGDNCKIELTEGADLGQNSINRFQKR